MNRIQQEPDTPLRLQPRPLNFEELTGSPSLGAPVSKDCGAYSVAIAAQRATNAVVSFQEAKALVDSDADGVCSLVDIVRGLEALGITAAPMFKGGGLPRGLSILHVRSTASAVAPDHFMVAEELKDGSYRFFVPPLGTMIGDLRSIAPMWQGTFVRLESGMAATASLPVLGLGATAVLAAMLLAIIRRRVRCVLGGRR